jgi:hypothetical protein
MRSDPHIAVIHVLLYCNLDMDDTKPDPRDRLRMDGPEKLKWYPAFLQAIQLELADYRDALEFKYERRLASEPLRVDLLVIKKPPDLVINKNIARIFRSDNLLEFKSPEDYGNICA